MRNSRLFWKLTLACAGLNCLSAIVVGMLLLHWLHDATVDPSAVRRWVWTLIAIESIAVFGIAYWFIGNLLRPIESIAAAADAIAAGDYQHRIYAPNRDELGMLAATLNRMSQALGQRMTQLSQTADRQSTVLGGMIEGVIAVDTRQRIVLANAAAGRLYGFRPGEVEGRALLEVVRNHALYAAVATSLSKGEPHRLETHRTGSTEQHIDIHLQPLPGEPCPGVVLVIHDTTELRRLESIRRDFVANVSHELKTPLSSIKAYAETLQNGASADPEVSQKFLSRIEEQADRLHHLIIDMLMLARIESDSQSFEIVSLDVADAVRACVENQRRAAEAKRITVGVSPCSSPSGAPCRVRADREGFRQILDNLVDNAIKYTPEGGKVTIAWNIKDDPAAGGAPANTCVISVTDTGIGIKQQDQDRVFERFYRVDKARSREVGSTGLGLSIVKHLVQSFSGHVGVESTPGQGSTFSFELPIA